MAFFEELKQRKVIRVVAAYLVGAWLAVQVASVALPAFEAPGWVLRVLILLLALGFPMALVLAWAVDLTPEGARFSPGGTGWKRLLAICGVLAAVAVGWYWFGQPAWRKGDLAPAAATSIAAGPKAAPVPARANPRSIAVLPFVNMSGDPANEYFSDGLAETTLDMLAQVHDLKVIARTSSFAFKGKPDDVRTIGRKLDAAHLLEGSVQQAGKTVRITAQLVRTSDGIHLWSKRFDRQMTDVFAVQDEIATEVVKALRVALPSGDAKRLTGGRTNNVEAYQAYLRGVALLPKRKVAGMREALTHFERAIALDPRYAEAWAAASATILLLQNYGARLAPDAEERQKRYFERALALDPGLGEAWAARAGYFQSNGDTAEAADSFRRATALAPNYATGFQWYGELLLTELGEPEKALPMLQRAMELDPLSPVIRSEYLRALAATGELDRAIRLTEENLRDNPGYAAGYLGLSSLLEARGDLVGALRALRTLERIDPDARRVGGARCQVLMRFDLAASRDCVARATATSAETDRERLQGLEVRLRLLEGDGEGALALLRAQPRPDPWELAVTLVAAGHGVEAVPVLQKLDPGMFVQPVPKLTSAYPGDAVLAGMALIDSGATAQGRDLLQRALRVNVAHPVDQLIFGRRWSDVGAWMALGDMPRACQALRDAVAGGFFLDLPDLDGTPAFAPLRKQACYQPALAPARKRVSAQLAAAREAGLLGR